ncbi:chromosome condensation protein CrcB [Bacillus sp. LL01]|uniref:fluoride efflux transporter FluC n=1 Tax=Bacillus sp. LL01 TaxID=1665556 RepID=UPI00064D2AE7|nr:CrcB family protein [Bacillus sp. LL01]KMJ58044.1 chromosome condensation protein CrcB [Bacillus sp. LL01]
MIKNILAVLVGGALGSLLRYGINLGTLSYSFPFGTLLENVIGSFLLGVLTGWFLYIKSAEWVKTGLGVGLCGGFTTMSTLAGDAFLMWSQATALLTAIYLFSSVIGGMLFAFIGIVSGRSLAERRLSVQKGGEVE